MTSEGDDKAEAEGRRPTLNPETLQDLTPDDGEDVLGGAIAHERCVEHSSPSTSCSGCASL